MSRAVSKAYSSGIEHSKVIFFWGAPDVRERIADLCKCPLKKEAEEGEDFSEHELSENSCEKLRQGGRRSEMR